MIVSNRAKTSRSAPARSMPESAAATRQREGERGLENHENEQGEVPPAEHGPARDERRRHFRLAQPDERHEKRREREREGGDSRGAEKGRGPAHGGEERHAPVRGPRCELNRVDRGADLVPGKCDLFAEVEVLGQLSDRALPRARFLGGRGRLQPRCEARFARSCPRRADSLEERRAAEQVEVVGVRVSSVGESFSAFAPACPRVGHARDSPAVQLGEAGIRGERVAHSLLDDDENDEDG
jgi:hypothetical protein